MDIILLSYGSILQGGPAGYQIAVIGEQSAEEVHPFRIVGTDLKAKPTLQALGYSVLMVMFFPFFTTKFADIHIGFAQILIDDPTVNNCFIERRKSAGPPGTLIPPPEEVGVSASSLFDEIFQEVTGLVMNHMR